MEQKKMSVIGKIWWVIYPALLYFGVNLASQLLVAVVVMVIGLTQGTIIPGTSPDTSFGSPLMTTIIYGSTILSGVVTITLGVLFMKRDNKRHGLVRDKLKRGTALSWVAIILIAASLIWVSAGLTQLLADYSPAHEETAQMLAAMGREYYIVFAVIFAPLSEEIICRGLIFKRFRSFMGFIPAAVISGAVFGVMHGNIVQGVYATLIGIVFAYIYEKKQSLFAPILAHFIVNGTNSALMYLPEDAALKFTEFYQGNYMLIVTIVAAVICVAGMFLLKKASKEKPALQAVADI
ncbi:MAG: CPBP family intramembrane metalloprotease [Ruminococcus sp.]|jgi:membrane protease YdiL (CAAX protease family)|nr:CPBP family intramembrane metalloprotease [Ruminococcus sp.]